MKQKVDDWYQGVRAGKGVSVEAKGICQTNAIFNSYFYIIPLTKNEIQILIGKTADFISNR